MTNQPNNVSAAGVSLPESPEAFALRLLVAGGLVSQEKVDSALSVAAKFRAHDNASAKATGQAVNLHVCESCDAVWKRNYLHLPEGCDADDWMAVPKKRGSQSLSTLIQVASLACIENRLLDADDRRELAEYADVIRNSSHCAAPSPAAREAGDGVTLTDGLKRIAHELRTYNPAADEYKGEHIHKVWAREIDELLREAGSR